MTNNGQPFRTNDWARLKRIAEGNPDETKIGAFGVGFYSVFSDCEEPFVSSGREAMAFYWKGNSLFTRKMQLPESQSSSDTTFVLDYRNKTTTVPSLLPLTQFLASSLTFVGLSNMELWLDDWRLVEFKKLMAPGTDVAIPRSLETKTTEGLVKVQSVTLETAQLDATWLNVVGWKPISIASTTSVSGSKGAPSSQSLRSFFSRFASSNSNAAAERAAREEREAQEAISDDLMKANKETVFFQVRTADLATTVSKSFAAELERATKKPPPKNTKLAVLTASYEGNELHQSPDGSKSQMTNIFASVLPSKAGRIFIGFPTHQTTGLAAHVSAPSIIPTVERESIDLNARWVRSWNQEMLRAAGIVCRIAWSSEVNLVKEKLSRLMKDENRSKVSTVDIQKVIPDAVHVLNEFSYKESTPSSQVGSLLEESFWTCDKFSSIEILSSRGVLPSQHVRLAADGLSFVEGIPVVPPTLLDRASGFVKKLVDYGIIVDITTADIKKELENQALNAKQLSEFLHWLVNKLRDEQIDSAVARSLLNVTVANDDEDGNKVIYLGQIKYYINPSKISLSLPVPPATVPYKFIRPFDWKYIQMLGWEDLQIVPWVRFLLDEQATKAEGQDLDVNPTFASQVLPVISKQWDGLSQGSKATIVSLLSTRTVIPTKLGMRKPPEAYFSSVKLFDDIPVVTVNAVKDRFLVALGVRKTIDLNLIFDRLLNAKKDDRSQSTWSHVELIKYLTSVRNDIPKDDIKKLQDTAICAAQNDATGQRYKVADLFEPKEELKSLGIKLLQWPGVYRSGSEEGKFLRSLGLRAYPSASELITLIFNAITVGDPSLRDRLLRYLVDFHHQHGYSASEIGSTNIAFLPLEGKEKGSATPSTCFTNEQASLLGYKILRRDLHPHASNLGVQTNPPINECVAWLIRHPPESQKSARQLFEYFASRLNELSGQPAELLSKSDIVPVISKSSALTEKATSGSFKRLPPTMCFLGMGGRYGDIFDHVDFGEGANAFLIRCGSKPEPSTHELARLIVHEPARVFTTFNSTEKYLDLLTNISRAWPTLKKDKNLVRSMRTSPFLLASTEYQPANLPPRNSVVEELDLDDDDDEQDTVKSWQLSQAGNIAIIDDVVNYGLFKSSVLAAPQEEELESFYVSLGAVTLSSIVVEREKIGSPNRDQAPASRLKKLVNERIKLFFHDVSKDQINRDAAWIEKNLHFVAVSSVQVQKSLKARFVRHTLDSSALFSNHPHMGPTIFFKPGVPDLFNVSQALLGIILHRPKPQQAILLTTLLETDLKKLRTRGYDVSRILRRRQIEARIAEEERRKRLEEEQLRIQEAGAIRQNTSETTDKETKSASMPGAFNDTPETEGRIGRHSFESNDSEKQSKGFFQNLSKNFTDRMQQARGRPLELPEHAQQHTQDNVLQSSLIKQSTSSTTSAPTAPTPAPATNPANLQQNLLNAIKATRPHNSQSVVSAPVINDVMETQTFCDAKPGQNISIFGEASSGIKIFLANTLANKQKFMAANSGGFNSFERVILIIAEVMSISRQSLHMFYDEESATIAFNSSGALFVNYRYFESLHLAEVQREELADAVVYWFVVCCHELAHNIVSDHSAAHSYYTYVSFLLLYSIVKTVSEANVLQ